jgi:uncharacterized protein (TIGR03086 family)
MGIRHGERIDLRELDRRVLSCIDPILAAVTVADLDAPTPCAMWTLRDLLQHMVGHHRGFAAAAAGTPVSAEVWDGAVLGPVPYDTYREAADLVTGAFAADDLLSRTMVIHGYGTFPASSALRMHSVDFLGHGWDVARSIGLDGALDEELCQVGLAIAAQWPATAWGPTGPFRDRVEVRAEAPAYQRLMGFLGRSPDWTPDHS